MKTTNKYQRNYMLAKSLLETLRLSAEETERKYIADHGIINADGSIPERIYCIDDESVFDKANEAMGKLFEESGMQKDLNEADDTLKKAENDLIAYGLSLAPKAQRDTLTKASATNYTTRQKIIDLVLKLDVSTVRA